MWGLTLSAGSFARLTLSKGLVALSTLTGTYKTEKLLVQTSAVDNDKYKLAVPCLKKGLRVRCHQQGFSQRGL